MIHVALKPNLRIFTLVGKVSPCGYLRVLVIRNTSQIVGNVGDCRYCVMLANAFFLFGNGSGLLGVCGGLTLVQLS